MLVRCILSQWAADANPSLRKVYEGDYDAATIKAFNDCNYNIFYLPNYPSRIVSGRPIEGSDIDRFEYVFVDMDLKSGAYEDCNQFINILSCAQSMTPSKIVYSGHGIHAYWRMTDLDALSFLRFQRRLCRFFRTDEAVSKIYQLMRLPQSRNVKYKGLPMDCIEIVTDVHPTYTCEQLDKALPLITQADEQYCQDHYKRTIGGKLTSDYDVNDKVPLKFMHLVKSNSEVAGIWSGGMTDRSGSDFRLGHIMYASDFSREDAISVLLNSPKAAQRTPASRISYAEGIVGKIWDIAPSDTFVALSSSVDDIMATVVESKDDLRFHCDRIVDGTHAGFKRGQVFGLVGGSGVGKTTFALNLFRWFVEANPEYTHFFVSLEQPVAEIAQRWVRMCGDNTRNHSKVQVLGNYNPDGTYRNLSLSQIKDYIIGYTKRTGKPAGCVVLDHIGILKKSSKNGEMQGLMEVCQNLKSFANETKTFFVVQSQTNRDKAGIGDIELDKGAAYGTTAFEWYVDYLVTIWAPLKRIYDLEPSMTVAAFKYCKIRDKNVKLDKIKEDKRHLLMFDVDTEQYRLLNQVEKDSYKYWNARATTKRQEDKQKDILEYTVEGWTDVKGN